MLAGAGGMVAEAGYLGWYSRLARCRTFGDEFVTSSRVRQTDRDHRVLTLDCVARESSRVADL